MFTIAGAIRFQENLLFSVFSVFIGFSFFKYGGNPVVILGAIPEYYLLEEKVSDIRGQRVLYKITVISVLFCLLVQILNHHPLQKRSEFFF